MTRDERIDSLKRRGFWFRPLVGGESITFHPAASRLMLGAESGIVMWDSPAAANGLGSRMVKVQGIYADGTRAIWNVRRSYCIAGNNKGESNALPV